MHKYHHISLNVSIHTTEIISAFSFILVTNMRWMVFIVFIEKKVHHECLMVSQWLAVGLCLLLLVK